MLKPTLKKAWWPHGDVIRAIFPDSSTPIISSKLHFMRVFSALKLVFMVRLCGHQFHSMRNMKWHVGSRWSCTLANGCVVVGAARAPPGQLSCRGGGGRKKLKGNQKQTFQGNKYRGSSSFRTSSSTELKVILATALRSYTTVSGEILINICSELDKH